jgi:hypothetical protein
MRKFLNSLIFPGYVSKDLYITKLSAVSLLGKYISPLFRYFSLFLKLNWQLLKWRTKLKARENGFCVYIKKSNTCLSLLWMSVVIWMRMAAIESYLDSKILLFLAKWDLKFPGLFLFKRLCTTLGNWRLPDNWVQKLWRSVQLNA